MEKLKEHSFKIQIGTFITVIGFVIYWTYVGSSGLNSLKHQVDDNTIAILNLQKSSLSAEINLAEIKVQLTNIEKTLTEIKTDLRNHSN